MVTSVGMQTEFIDAVKELIELDYDAIGAYEAAIIRLERAEYRKKLQEFKEDHERHVKELTAFLTTLGKATPSGPDNTKSLMAKAKVILGSIIGDGKILSAMLSNEADTNTAYERMNKRADELPGSNIHKIIARGLEDEIKHKNWLETVLEER
jgi:ferritin-like metal-binding protein YciE